MRFQAAAACAIALAVLCGCEMASGASGRSRPPAASPTGWFEDRTTASGVRFRLGHGDKSPLTVLEEMGTGCAIFDYDADGHADLFLVGQQGVGDSGSRLFHNN